MPQVILSEQVSVDLQEIWARIAVNSLQYADQFIDRLDEAFAVIGRLPGIGTARNDLQDGLRTLPVGNYVIFFRLRNSRVEIVRVLHGARYFPSEFGRE